MDNSLLEEIVSMAQEYFTVLDDEIGDNTGFIRLLVLSLVDEYKNKRNYPVSMSEEAINSDVMRYFTRRKVNIAMKVIPELHTRLGAEGQSMVTDNGITHMFVAENYLGDVVPYCEVV